MIKLSPWLLVPFAAFADQPAELEPLVVIGSSIEHNEVQRSLPISVMTAAQIRQTGVRTINDLLKYLPEVDFYDYGSQQGLSDRPGSSFIQLRGLSAKNTLVLLDGNRMPLNPVQSDDGEGAATDINLIPLSSIERVEILKSGSSAVYGSDAVAGVVNFVTKKSANSANVFGNYGNSIRSDGEEKNVGFSAGLGNAQKDRMSSFISFEYFQRDPVFRADRALSSTVDFRQFGGSDLRSANAPEGNIIKGPGVGTSYRTCAPENLNGNLCRYNYNNYPSTELIGGERFQTFASNTLKITNSLRLDTSFIYSRNGTSSQNHPIPDNFLLPNGDTIRGRFMQGGNRTLERESEFLQITSKLSGELLGQFWDISVGYGKNSNRGVYGNFYLRDPLNQSIASGAIDPTIITNNQALIDALKLQFNILSQTELVFTNFKFEGDLIDRKNVRLGYAAGMQWRHESLSDKPDAIAQTGAIAGSAAFSGVEAARDVLSGFSEFKLDVFKKAEMQAAVRYDGYDTTENISPMFSLALHPYSTLTLRGNWGMSFLMPTFRQIYASGTQSAVTLQGKDCLLVGLPSNCVQPGFKVTGNSLNLKPETAINWGVGLSWQPFTFVNTTFDFWQIQKSNEITTPSYQIALGQGRYSLVDNNVFINMNNVNLASSLYQGVDAGVNFNWDLGAWGNVSLNNKLTYYLQINRKLSPQSETETLLNYAANVPPWRWMSMLTWKKGDWSSSFIARSTAGFIDTFTYPTNSNPTAPNTPTVGSYTEMDLLLTYSGIKNLSLSIAAKNLTDEQPPFSAAASQSTFGFAHAALYDNRGTFLLMTANYQFDY